MRPGLRLVILEIPVRRDERLPDAVQVGVAVGQPRRAIGRWKLLASLWTLLAEEGRNSEREKNADAGDAKEHHHAPKLHTGPPEVPRCRSVVVPRPVAAVKEKYKSLLDGHVPGGRRVT